MHCLSYNIYIVYIILDIFIMVKTRLPLSMPGFFVLCKCISQEKVATSFFC